MIEDVKAFCKTCLHCVVNGDLVVPRPLGEQLHAVRPNEVLHYDYLKIGKPSDASVHNYEYVLVLKDDFSGFVELIPCVSPDHFNVADAMIGWYKRFGVMKYHVSDQGIHFKDKLLAELNRLLQIKHHFVTAYSPWANGTVEVVNREIVNCMKSLLSEFRMEFDRWTEILPLVQHVINHTPSRRLDGQAPVTVMTGLPPSLIFDYVYSRLDDTIYRNPLTPKEIRKITEKLRDSLRDMHKRVNASLKRTRRGKRKSADKNRHAKSLKLAVGDFVLVAVPKGRKRHKLQTKWTGPWRVIRTLSEWVYVVECLVTGEEKSVHVCRLRLYADDLLNITSDLKNQIMHDSWRFQVEEIIGIREVDSQIELKIKWLGFPDEESSWEPLRVIYADVPRKLKQYVATLDDSWKSKLIFV